MGRLDAIDIMTKNVLCQGKSGFRNPCVVIHQFVGARGLEEGLLDLERPEIYESPTVTCIPQAERSANHLLEVNIHRLLGNRLDDFTEETIVRIRVMCLAGPYRVESGATESAQSRSPLGCLAHSLFRPSAHP